DLNSPSMNEAGIAISGPSCFIHGDLALFLNNPDALKPAFPRLKEKIEDFDPGVQLAAVNVICELARRNPKNYLSLTPIFFRLMTTSTNN
ncbi:unnamed protein product, partial [Rotaria sp. Silwood1]